MILWGSVEGTSVPSRCKKENWGFDSVEGGQGSSVGIGTDYGLDGSGWNPGGDKIFRRSRPALGPTQSFVQLVPGLFRE